MNKLANSPHQSQPPVLGLHGSRVIPSCKIPVFLEANGLPPGLHGPLPWLSVFFFFFLALFLMLLGYKKWFPLLVIPVLWPHGLTDHPSHSAASPPLRTSSSFFNPKRLSGRTSPSRRIFLNFFPRILLDLTTRIVSFFG